MKSIIETLHLAVVESISQLYDSNINADAVNIQPTRKEFEGDYTLVVFPFLKTSKKKPEATAEECFYNSTTANCHQHQLWAI